MSMKIIVAVGVVAVLAWGLLSSAGAYSDIANGVIGGIAAQTGDETPTPQPQPQPQQQQPEPPPAPPPAAPLSEADIAQMEREILEQYAKMKPSAHPNMDSTLNRIVEDYEQGGQSFESAKGAADSAPIAEDASVAVTLYTDEGRAEEVAAWLEDNGGDPRNIGEDYIEAYIPVWLLARASEAPGVQSVETIIPPQPAQGSTGGEGAGPHGALNWHAAGYTGSGVKVGIIGGGFRGFSALMGNGLPTDVTARCYTSVGVHTSNIADCETGNSVHGTAVSEILADIAPDMSLYIANPSSYDDLLSAASWMAQNDVQVINHSWNWIWQGPGDGTSPFSNSALKAVDTAVQGGAIWVNTTGNSAQRTWFGQFNPTRPSSSGARLHRFEGSVTCNNVSNVNRGGRLLAQLRWEDTWFGAARNMDLLLYEISSTGRFTLRDASVDVQSGGSRHIPRELLSYTFPNSGRYCLSIGSLRRSSTGDPSWVQLHSIYHDLAGPTAGGSIRNPGESANPGMLAVGAAGWDNPSEIRRYSSRGPTPDGRVKPDITGADATSTDLWDSGFFYGTSAGSPHVAGLAALVRQRFPAYSPAQVAEYLKTNAEARGAKPNNTWGHGFAKLPPIAAAQTTPTPTMTPASGAVPTLTPTPTSAAGGGGSTAAHVRALSDLGFRYTGIDRYRQVNAACGAALAHAQTRSAQTLSDAERASILTIQWVCYDAAARLNAPPPAGGTPQPTATPTITATPTLTPTVTPTQIPGQPTWTPVPSATPSATPEMACDFQNYAPPGSPPDTPLIKARAHPRSFILYYYTPEYPLYSGITSYDSLFCTESEAQAAGYQKHPNHP